MIRRSDLDRVSVVFEEAGFLYEHPSRVNLFRDHENIKVRDAVRLVFAEEIVRNEELLPNQDVVEGEFVGPYRILSLRARVQIEFSEFRLENRVNLRDLLDVGLIGRSWLDHSTPRASGQAARSHRQSGWMIRSTASPSTLFARCFQVRIEPIGNGFHI